MKLHRVRQLTDGIKTLIRGFSLVSFFEEARRRFFCDYLLKNPYGVPDSVPQFYLFILLPLERQEQFNDGVGIANMR